MNVAIDNYRKQLTSNVTGQLQVVVAAAEVVVVVVVVVVVAIIIILV